MNFKSHKISTAIKSFNTAIYNFSKNIPDIAENLMNKYWPGPLTAVIELDQKIDSKNLEIEVEKIKYKAVIEKKPLHDPDNKIIKN